MSDSARIALDHTFTDPNLLRQALTHRSYGVPHNERLEFIGDAILNCVVALTLYERYPDLPEGDLSRVRAHLVNKDMLAQVARRLGLGAMIRLGEGEIRSGGAARASILADAMEAVFGAVFLDAGFVEARRTIDAAYADLLREADPARSAGPEDAAAGVAAGAAAAGAGICDRRDDRRSACAAVRRRMPDTRACDHRHGLGQQPPCRRAGRRRIGARRGAVEGCEDVTDAAVARCGHVAIVGRPSVGKSTLLNALVGARISITSRKPQTTRHRISGIRTDGYAQFIFVDTPGFQTRHASKLNERLNRAVREALADVDVVVFVVDAHASPRIAR